MTEPKNVLTEVDYIADRLRACLRIIDATPQTVPDQKALVWMLVEELAGLVSRAWRWAR